MNKRFYNLKILDDFINLENNKGLFDLEIKNSLWITIKLLIKYILKK